MTAPLGSYTFLSWLRRGIGAGIARVDGTGSDARVDLAVTISLNQGGMSAPAALALTGPGEIAGIDPRVISRVWPRPGVSDAEPNYFPLLELSEPDLPWRYTPARATPADRLRPWLTVITLRDDEISSFFPASSGGALARVTVTNGAVLPAPDASWAWAHLQVAGTAVATAAEVEGLIANQPQRVVARLLSPRRLDPGVAYTAYLVPSFERGRLAGLGLDVPADLDGLAPAWTAAAVAIELPVYFSWRFTTGTGGDFELLARQLQARALPGDVGVRGLDTTELETPPGPAASSPLDLTGALIAPATVPAPWPPAERDPFVAALGEILDRPADLLADPTADRAVAPPLYGRWHAAKDRLAPAEPPVWFAELNADPRFRVAASLGAQVVTSRAAALMASAWQQVDRIREANEALRFAQLARALGGSLYRRHLVGSDETVLAVSAPVLARVKASPKTILATMAASPAGTSLLSSSFRRVTRPRGPLARRLGARPPGGRPLLERANRGDIVAATPPALPGPVVDAGRPGPGAVPDAAAVAALARRRAFWLVAAIVLGLIAVVLLASGMAAAAIALALGAVGAVVTARRAEQALVGARRLVALRDGTLTSADLRAAPAPAAFAPVEGDPPAAAPPSTAAAERFRTEAAVLLDALAKPIPPGPVLRPAPLPALRAKVVTALDPRTTALEAIRARLAIDPVLGWKPPDPLDAVMAYPIFDQPMYEPLAELSADWLLPGLARVPPETVSLVESNRPFIEAYMVGLNHAMARELLWNEFPTDQRGSYFRQFWDVRGAAAATTTDAAREALRDIERITRWDPTHALGDNPPAGAAVVEGNLVLLIRGELLRRYPNAVIYAVKAVVSDGGRTPSDASADERYPLFSGRLDPDVTFLGFDLTATEARGGSAPTDDPGWYFVIQQQPTEPRFGLDAAVFPAPPLTSWNDLSWAHLAPDAQALAQIVYPNLDADLPDTRAVTEPAGEPPAVWHADHGLGPSGTRAAELAYITLQRPVRIAIHASRMLP